MKKSLKPDRLLVTRLQRSDIHAFDALYWKYHQALYKNIIKFTKDRHAAEDILQDVFVVLWEKRRDIEPEQSVSGWLFVISFNKAVSYLRKQLKKSEAINDWLIRNAGEKILLPESEKPLNAGYWIDQAVAKLSPQKQQVFILCKLEGKSYEETARKLNISKHTVKEYLSLAVTSVKDYIRKHAVYWETVILCILSTPLFYILLRIY